MAGALCPPRRRGCNRQDEKRRSGRYGARAILPGKVSPVSSSVPFDQPFEEFTRWFAAARAAEPLAEAMALATADASGAPAVRMVLLKGADRRGFVFYTNFDSRKGAELAANPRAALCLYWKSLNRQIRIEGAVAPVSAAEADAYFTSRPRESQLGAWASLQSRPLADRAELDARLAAVRERFDGVEDVPRPETWGGFVLRPRTIEFWQGQQARLHDRFLYTRDRDDAWQIERLAP